MKFLNIWPCRTVASAIAVLAFAVLFLAPANAQFIRDLRNMGLSGADADLAIETAKGLYTNPSVSTGDKEEWRSSATDARGMVVVTNVNSDQGCVSFYHQFFPRAGEPGRRLDFKRCRTSSGKWLLEVVPRFPGG